MVMEAKAPMKLEPLVDESAKSVKVKKESEFATQCDLEMHEVNGNVKPTSQNVKRFKCELCENVFASEKDLNGHINIIHETEKNTCKTCGKSFRHGANLKKHEDVHRAGAPNIFKCKKCEKVFGKKLNLQLHFTAIHGDKIFNCNQCK